MRLMQRKPPHGVQGLQPGTTLGMWPGAQGPRSLTYRGRAECGGQYGDGAKTDDNGAAAQRSGGNHRVTAAAAHKGGHDSKAHRVRQW